MSDEIAALRAEVRELRAAVERLLTPVRPKTEPQHGTVSMYMNKRCRCDECRAANARYARELRARKAAQS